MKEQKQPSLFSEAVAESYTAYQLSAMPDREPEKPLVSFLPGVPADKRIATLDREVLSKMITACQGCSLQESCTQKVLGTGSTAADIMFIGEGPGKDEDLQGVPFVGRAGQLLDKILAAVDFARQEVYITNVVKCRPPGNRMPLPAEIKNCLPFLEAEIELVKPRFIVCLGALATQNVLSPKARITKVRGQVFARGAISIMPVLHPAALLRNPDYKRPTWEDFKLLRDLYRQEQLSHSE